MTGTGMGLTGASALGEFFTAGVGSPVFVTTGAGGVGLTLSGVAVTGVGLYTLYNYMNLPPLQSPDSNSGGGGSSNSGSTSSGSGGNSGGGQGETPTVDNPSHPPLQGARLQYYLGLQDAGALDSSGDLTPSAINNAQEIIPGKDLKNPDVINALTQDGSSINDWSKKSTTVTLQSGQNVQVHFYQNNVTGAVNYSVDFKISDVRGVGDIPLNH